LHGFIPPCPPCAGLVTSCIHNLSHAIPAGATLTLDRMTPEQARQLLAAALTEAALAAEPETVNRLLERCQHNPLALEIAAHLQASLWMTA
jgi:hypothetical protein